MPWRRKWLPTPVFLPGEFHGQRSLAGYSRQVRSQTQLSLPSFSKVRQEFSVIHSKFCVSVLCTLIRLAPPPHLLIGKKWIYLEMHITDNAVSLKRQEPPREKHTPSRSVGHLRRRETWRPVSRFEVLVLLIKSLVH